MKYDRDSLQSARQKEKAVPHKTQSALGDRHIDQRWLLRQQKPLKARAVIESQNYVTKFKATHVVERPPVRSIEMNNLEGLVEA